MSTHKVVENILASGYPEWKKSAPLPPDLLFLCVDYLAESCVLHYPNTTTKSMRGVLFDGRRYGKWTEWYKNGKRKSRTMYVKGRKHGKHKSWFNDGDLEEKGVYVRGKEDGLWLTYWDNSMIKRRRIEQEYSKGKLHGITRIYYKSGQLSSEIHYKHGKQHGTDTHWCEDGTIFSLDTYKRGKKHGECKGWYSDGDLHYQSYFDNGIFIKSC